MSHEMCLLMLLDAGRSAINKPRTVQHSCDSEGN